MPTIEINFYVSVLFDNVDDYTVSVDLTDEQFEILKNEYVVLQQPGEDDAPEWSFDLDRIGEDMANEPFNADDIVTLADALLRLSKLGQAITHTEAVDLIAYCLGAPEWSPSFLEDIRDIINRTDRSTVKGATWDRH